MKKTNYPVMVGKNLHMGVSVGFNKEAGGADMVFVRLKDGIASGDPFGKDDIKNIDTIVHFCDRNSVKVTIDALQRLLAAWKE